MVDLRALHTRIGLGVAGLLIVGGILVVRGNLAPPNVVQLDFAMYPEIFEGCDVEIDGEIVGSLKTHGATMRTGFDVELGRHDVRVLHPEYDCEPAKVHIELEGQKTRLMMDLEDVYDRRTRKSKTMIVLRS